MAEAFDLIVVGSGPGGYVAAIRAAQLGLKTACIEKNPALGGTCLNVGCIPSKTLLQSTELYWKLLHDAKELGVECTAPTANFSQMMLRKQKVIKSFNEGIAGLFKKNKIASFVGTASFIDAHTLSCKREGKEEILSAKHILLATGSMPIELPFLPLDEKQIVSSTGALSLEAVPRKMAVVGAGVIGVELGSVYKRLGAEVTFIEFLDRICPTFDLSVSQALEKSLTAQGMVFHLSSKVTAAEKTPEGVTLTVTKPDQSTMRLTADVVLVAVGRKPNTQGLGLEKAGITLNSKGQIPIDGLFRTTVPHIFAIGDVIDGPMLAHKASEEGVAVAEIIAGHTPAINYLAIPNVVYTHPEVASVGMSEAEAKEHGITLKTGNFFFKANSRAKCSGEEEGFVKIIAEASSDKILGIQIIGAHASELIAEGVLALEKRSTLQDIGNIAHAHPTLSEALKEAALAALGRAIHK